MTLTTGRWTLWTYGAHPFAPQDDRAQRQLALEPYAPKGDDHVALLDRDDAR